MSMVEVKVSTRKVKVFAGEVKSSCGHKVNDRDNAQTQLASQEVCDSNSAATSRRGFRGGRSRRAIMIREGGTFSSRSFSTDC